MVDKFAGEIIMKLQSLAIFGAIFLFIAVSANAQVAAAKIAFINTEMFLDEKGGITRFVSAYKKLEIEFKPAQDELNTINTKMESLAKEVQDMQKQLSGAVTGPPIDKNPACRKNKCKNRRGSESANSVQTKTGRCQDEI